MIRRSGIDTASFACSVVITLCPVEAAAIAALAESRFWISPIISISGSCRRVVAMATTQARVTSSGSLLSQMIGHWIAPGIFPSGGSSTVVRRFFPPLCFSSSLHSARSVVDLPEPVGPELIMMPSGRLNIFLMVAICSGRKPRDPVVGGSPSSWGMTRMTTSRPPTQG
ncbi:Uncharacterised protein [Serratia fonticola]|nr:Uncharacterised protein [Serratia fonticola]